MNPCVEVDGGIRKDLNEPVSTFGLCRRRKRSATVAWNEIKGVAEDLQDRLSKAPMDRRSKLMLTG